jgi:hypothetical protein
MTMENPGHKDTKPTAGNVQPPVAEVVANPSRRRFNRAGIGASAVVLTLASRSVLADTVCKTPSGFDSLSPSMAGNTPNDCSGKSGSLWLMQDLWPIAKETPFASIFGQGYPNLYAGASSAAVAGLGTAAANAGKSWYEPFSNNAGAGNSGSSNAGSNGNGNGNNGNGLGNGVVKSNASDNNELLLKDATLVQALAGSRTPPVVKNLIAALLNFRAKLNTFPTDTEVVRIFQEWQQKGYYEVRASVKWFEADINRYLASTNSVG